MNRILYLLVSLCLCTDCFGQKINIEPYYIGERVPDIVFSKVANHTVDTMSFSSLGAKVIILDFWHTHCGSCIAMFPLEDSLQHEYNDRLQFVLVTAEDAETTRDFLQRRDSLLHTHFALPVITSDIMLNKMFPHRYNPHYVWLAPGGEVLAETTSLSINKKSVEAMLAAVMADRKRRKERGYPMERLRYTKPDKVQAAYLSVHAY